MTSHFTYELVGRSSDQTRRRLKLAFSNDTAVADLGLEPHLRYGFAFQPDTEAIAVLSHHLRANELAAPLQDDEWWPMLEFTRPSWSDRGAESGWRIEKLLVDMRAFGFPDPGDWDGSVEVLSTAGGVCRLRMLNLRVMHKHPRARGQRMLRI